MTLPDLIYSLIELSTEEMPDEARKSLDDAIDHIVSSMTDGELEGLLVKSVDKIKVKVLEIKSAEQKVRAVEKYYKKFKNLRSGKVK